MYDLALLHGNVFLNMQFQKTNIYIKDGVIALIDEEVFDATEQYDCEGKHVIPGIIDPHTHMELDLGHITSKDDFFTGTKAAAFGGVTTIIDFLDPVNNVKDLEESFIKRSNQAKKSVIDYKFHACLKNPQNEVENIVNALPLFGLDTVKIFTTYSDSDRRTYDEEIKQLLTLSKDHNFMVTAHIENDELISNNSKDSYQKLVENRSTFSEISEALKLASFVKKTGGYLYMVHLSSGETLDQLKLRYRDILNTHFMIESCPHYFLWNKQEVLSDEGYKYTMAPPLRSELERKKLQSLFKHVMTIGTDHCPFNLEDKNQKLLKDMPLGIGGIEESFRVMYTMFGDKAIPKMTENVAKVHKLYPQKGVIAVGSDADFCIFELSNARIDSFHSVADYSAYEGIHVNTEIISTISRGNFVVKEKQFITHQGTRLNKVGDHLEYN